MTDAITHPINRRRRLKKLTIIIGGLIAMAFIGTLAGWPGLSGQHGPPVQSERERQEVMNTLYQTCAILQQFADRAELPLNQRTPLGTNTDYATNALLRVDVSRCPPNFQEKFAALIKAWRNVSAEAKSDVEGTVASELIELIRDDFKLPYNYGNAKNVVVKTFQDARIDLDRWIIEHLKAPTGGMGIPL